MNLILVIAFFLFTFTYGIENDKKSLKGFKNISFETIYDFEKGSSATLTKGKVNYSIEGRNNTGRLVVCLHSYLSTMSDCSSIGKMLSGYNYRVLRFDFYGHGNSDWHYFGSYSPSVYVAQTVELLNYLGFGEEQLNVIGISMGGLVAIYFANSFSGKIEKLVLDSPAGLIKDAPWYYSIMRYRMLNYPAQLLCQMIFPRKIAQLVLNPPGQKDTNFKMLWRLNNYYRQYLATSLQFMIGFDVINEESSFETLARNMNKVLVFWGARDRVSKLKYYEPFFNSHQNKFILLVSETAKHRVTRFDKLFVLKNLIKFYDNNI